MSPIYEYIVIEVRDKDELERQLIPISCNAAVFSLTRVDGFPLSRE